MAGLTRVLMLWRNLTRRAAVERDLDDEVRATLAMLVDEKRRAGLSVEAAEREARLELGHATARKLDDQARRRLPRAKKLEPSAQSAALELFKIRPGTPDGGF